jgi:hypothetical protein
LLTAEQAAAIARTIGHEAERVARAVVAGRPGGLRLSETVVALARIRRRLVRLAKRLEAGQGRRRGP